MIGASKIPVIPKHASMTNSANSNSQAEALIRVPIILALIKYSSLCMNIKKVSAAIATLNERLMLMTEISVLEIKLPTTGMRPVTKVKITMVLL